MAGAISGQTGFALRVDDNYLRATAARHGCFLRRDVLACGGDDRVIVRMLRGGMWIRVRRGTYSFPDVWNSLSDRQRHGARSHGVLAGARVGVALSHVSAAHALDVDVWDLDEEMVHLTRADGRAGRHETGVTQHKGWLGAGDVTIANGRLITNGTRTALDITRIADVEHSLVIMNSMLHEGHTTVAHLVARAATMTHWPNSLATDLVIRLADSRIESVGESRTLFHMWSQHLPLAVPQYEIWHQGRLVARLDFAWPELGVWVEFDGKGKYLKSLRDGESVSDVVVREKRREDEIRRITGWICVRLTWADLYDPARLAEKVRRAFADAAQMRGSRPDLYAS